jgi:hypothetical protein
MPQWTGEHALWLDGFLPPLRGRVRRRPARVARRQSDTAGNVGNRTGRQMGQRPCQTGVGHGPCGRHRSMGLPADGKGDCEDYALFKRARSSWTKAAGRGVRLVPEDRLKLAIVEPHRHRRRISRRSLRSLRRESLCGARPPRRAKSRTYWRAIRRWCRKSRSAGCARRTASCPQ